MRVVGELITDVENQKSWLWRHCEQTVAVTPSPSQTCHAKLETQINRRRTTSFFPLVGYLPQAACLKDFSPKSQDAVALQQIKERGALPWLIVVISSGNRPLRQYLGFTAPGAGYGQFQA